jgi:beta-lactamase regulating signal transducer with metallopeptidase domain
VLTILFLAAGWLLIAGLVHGRANRVRDSLPPRMQAGLLGAAILGLAIAPLALVSTVLSRALTSAGDGSRLSRCGRLILAVLTKPLAHPEVTLSVVVLGIFAVGMAVGVVRTWRSQLEARKVTRGFSGRVVVVPSEAPAAFTVGLLKPKIVVSTALVDQTDPESLRVVLAHEEAHRRGRHPLVLMLTESVARGLAFWPLAAAAGKLRLALEMMADEAAAEFLGDRVTVANTIRDLALVQAPATVGFEGETIARIRRLIDGSGARRPVATLAITLAALFVIVFSGGHALHCSRMSYDALKTQVCPLNMDMHPMR